MDTEIHFVKKLGKNINDENCRRLMELFEQQNEIDIKSEIVSAIGKQVNNDSIFAFISSEALNKENPMELIYQMYRICLYKGKTDKRFAALGERIKCKYENENIDKMKAYFDYRQSRHKRKRSAIIEKPILLVGDSEKTLRTLPEQSIQLIFTSPPYYNARIYSDYRSYAEYLKKMSSVLKACNRVLEEGRFIIVNVSPVITKRAGREFESIRYPIHYDFHSLLIRNGFYFVDEIIWIKPEPSVPNRNGGYIRTRKPLSYKPNCITESLMVYRKKCSFLLDKNISDYGNDYDRFEDEKIDTSNCWYITPRADKNHPAVFPDELCRRVIKYYSFEGDAVLDPFAGSGTVGRVAQGMKRVPVMCEINREYVHLIENEL